MLHASLQNPLLLNFKNTPRSQHFRELFKVKKNIKKKKGKAREKNTYFIIF